ncbi:acetyl-CoA acetyltransferase [Xanthomonas citri pv. fuscans]|uniref:Acetyl-CoA acetyltransferase n=1 Tax=Xanthomonas citri pv. fuscans TaxID=366649 RepID=A0AB34Q3T5_XANCI|nr:MULTISPECIES: acetyl-CoA C-acyltransferase [Xanthomonas]ATB57951.1 putative acetyl-CoA C-acetyltransferase [Xanthomonas citri pv. fuscans]ATS62731.1 acetyl-CoA C-acyltransferase [Xanthomonas citri pv. phaseoli var. fuscans]ATS69757.1 acetyl-CoA C-acyltransferase [Xanthomonas citri pv. phaseoli var. fuscans]ATS72235.1 acetyl-CoA C-acyltransferase [Xanthomonas citri pv. phaseoli var. fuscans]ATS75000.1 acetyl-CoA C-acyltransferase [Xanthomonas citri pv. phaseoli var. fuscans]
MSDIVIVAAKRTAIGSFLGQFNAVPAPTLAAAAIQGALAQSGIAPADISEVIVGCVLPANLGQAPARQAAIAAGIPTSTGATTINKVCGSGMKAIMLGHDLIKAGSASIVVAGGMESMSNAPHLLPNSRTGNRYGNFQAVDHMAWDGLTNPYDGQAMGVFGEATAEKFGFSRADQDAFAIASVERAQAAQRSGAFAEEIVPVTVATRKGEVVVDSDEQPGKSDVAKIPTLKPAFKKDGSVTAASSSSISDGAAITVLMSADDAQRRGLTPLARIVGHVTHAQEPEWFTTAPVAAIQSLVSKLGWRLDDVDLFEINEAFAVVAMAPISQLGIAHDKVNVHGGACALGHPIGASGARLVVTLVNALRSRGGKRGIATLCIGGGEATAIAIELI